MQDAAPLNHPAVVALLALQPKLPEEFVSSIAIIQRDFFDDEDLMADQTVLSVGRRATANYGDEITVVTRTGDGQLRVHGCMVDDEQPAYGYNSYDSAASMIKYQDSALSAGETWCGGYERELFGRLAA